MISYLHATREALEQGLVNRVVAPEQLEATTLGFLDRLLESSGPVIALGMHTLWRFVSLFGCDYGARWGQFIGFVGICLYVNGEAGKRTFYSQRQQPLDEAYKTAVDAMVKNMCTIADATEGISAFVGKKKAQWRHK